MNGVCAVEKTLVLVKPDGVRRRLSGEIIARFEKRGLQIVALKLMQISTILISGMRYGMI